MSRYVLSPRARRDLEEIWDYTAAEWSDDQAEHYTRILQQAIKAVAANPRIGRACDDIRTGYLKYPAGSHVLFYRLIDGGIDIVRILHPRMDFDRHL